VIVEKMWFTHFGLAWIEVQVVELTFESLLPLTFITLAVSTANFRHLGFFDVLSVR
jgi:hypothetical protein